MKLDTSVCKCKKHSNLHIYVQTIYTQINKNIRFHLICAGSNYQNRLSQRLK